MKGYIQLLRPKHGVKNLLVLFPLVFSGRLWEGELLARSLWAALAFWGAAGVVYIFNDVRDRERDRLHPTKCRRPIASGAVSVPRAAAEGAVLIALTAGIFPLGRLPAESGGCLILYILLNLGYSLGLKDVPILDLAILVSGFLLRVLFGAAVTGIAVSGWLYLTVTALSFYLGLSKRRGELRTARGGRPPGAALLQRRVPLPEHADVPHPGGGILRPVDGGPGPGPGVDGAPDALPVSEIQHGGGGELRRRPGGGALPGPGAAALRGRLRRPHPGAAVPAVRGGCEKIFCGVKNFFKTG